MNGSLRLSWCDDAGLIPALVSFFIENTDPRYISHGELMDGRAKDLDEWSEALPRVLAEEYRESEFAARPTRPTGKRIAIAENADGLTALALVELSGEEPNRFAVIHDLIVSRSYRGAGIGAQLLSWLEKSFCEEGIALVFLESGLRNEAAHLFFERAGYYTSSVTMMKKLRPEPPK